MALWWDGGSLTKRELALATGYTDKPVAQGLALLEQQGMARNNGRSIGWNLHLASPVVVDLTSAVLVNSGRKNFSDFSSSSSSTNSRSMFGEEEEEEKNGRGRKNLGEGGWPTEVGSTAAELPGASQADRTEIAAWLVKAGVGPKSHKLGKLLQLGLSVEYVMAWSLYYQWWHREKERRSHGRRSGEAVDGRRRFSAGTLIRILEDGDPAPAMRCEECLETLPCYCDVVQR